MTEWAIERKREGGRDRDRQGRRRGREEREIKYNECTCETEYCI